MIHTDQLTNWYNFQARFYHSWRDRYDGALVKTVADMLDCRPGQKVLDAGCGSGLFAVGLAQLFPETEFAGVDLAEGMLAIARKEASRRGLENVEFRVGDLQDVDSPDASFDAVVMGGVMPLFEDRAAVFREFKRLLKPGGRAVLIEFDRDSIGALSRLVFGAMIMGHRAVSTFFPRYRFSDKWTTALSTVPVDDAVGSLKAGGLEIDTELRVASHYMICGRKKGE